MKNTDVIKQLSKVYHTWIKSDNNYSQTNNALTNVGNVEFFTKYCKAIRETEVGWLDTAIHIVNNPDLLKLEGFRCNPYLNQVTSASVCKFNKDTEAITIIHEAVINRDFHLWNDFALTHLFNKPNSTSLVVQEFGHSYKDPIHTVQLNSRVNEINGMWHNMRRFDLRTEDTWDNWLKHKFHDARWNQK